MLDLAVVGMTCGHCVRAVSEAVGCLPGVVGVAVDLASGHLRIQGEPDMSVVRSVIEQEGYTVLQAT